MILTETSVPKGLPKSRLHWYLPIAIGLSLIFLYLAIRGVNWDEFLSSLQHCQAVYLLPAIFITLINFFVRSQRWGILVRANQPVPTLTMFWSTGVGYLGNNFLPFRTGEILRSIALGYKTGMSKIYVLATALTERVIDAIFLIILGILLIPSIHTIPEWLPPAMWTLGFLGFTAMLLLLFAPHLEKQIKYILDHFPLPANWRLALQNWLEQFLQGAASFQNPGRSVQFFILTCLIWLLDALGMMFSGRAFSLDISISQSLLLLVGLGLSSAIPSAPGYIGVFQFVAVNILGIFAYPKSQVLAFILVAQATGMLLTLIWGLVGLWTMGINPGELNRKMLTESGSR
jgi:uncharacterized protein (TIRG00374 family)